ncbi:MAG: hypothetical protein HYZ91_05100 [Candidatus Omnitrophica bacterium]|nr:hypothetical protein [Candidatus Omnitrophota bacterium]
MPHPARTMATRIATVGGLGTIPPAPGTWGSGVGVAVGWSLSQAAELPRALVLGVTWLLGAVLCTRAEGAAVYAGAALLVIRHLSG